MEPGLDLALPAGIRDHQQNFSAIVGAILRDGEPDITPNPIHLFYNHRAGI
jgi:hypothetical protein